MLDARRRAPTTDTLKKKTDNKRLGLGMRMAFSAVFLVHHVRAPRQRVAPYVRLKIDRAL